MKKKKRGVPTARGSVIIITALLVASAGVRLVTSATQAFAADAEESVELPVVPDDRIRPTEIPEEPTYGRLAEFLRDREIELEKREQAVTTKEAQIEDAKVEIAAKLEQLEDAEKRLRATIALAKTAAEDDLANLTTVYENMKPKDASALFEQMDPEFAAGFLGRMRPDSAANIMAGLTPQVAYSISAILAGRNANVPTE